MEIDITSIPNALEQRAGLPRPDWTTIANCVENHVPKVPLNEAWTNLAHQWLEQLTRALGGDYRILQSEEFYLLSAGGDAINNRLLCWCETFRERILTTLPGVANDEGYGKQVLLCFAARETYYDYVADFYPDEGEFALSAGTFLDDGYGHLAICAELEHDLDRTIAHELTHAMLRHLPLPPWLNEGVTQVVEDIVVGGSSFIMNRELAERHRGYWTDDTIHHFWSGEAFHFPNDGQELSYSLAQVLFRNILSDYPRKTCDFLNDASFSDAGNQALLETCGVNLAERAAQFLGAGNWAPRSDYWADLHNNGPCDEPPRGF